jgi:hypothetical protein
MTLSAHDTAAACCPPRRTTSERTKLREVHYETRLPRGVTDDHHRAATQGCPNDSAGVFDVRPTTVRPERGTLYASCAPARATHRALALAAQKLAEVNPRPVAVWLSAATTPIDSAGDVCHRTAGRRRRGPSARTRCRAERTRRAAGFT